MLRYAIIAVFSLSACLPVHTQRQISPAAELYAQAHPFYENTMALVPRVKLLVHEVPTGGIIVGENGAIGHWHGLRHDIELFFARMIDDPKQRISLAKRAITLTCPDTDLTGLADKIIVTSKTYMVFKDVTCIGAKRS